MVAGDGLGRIAGPGVAPSVAEEAGEWESAGECMYCDLMLSAAGDWEFEDIINLRRWDLTYDGGGQIDKIKLKRWDAAAALAPSYFTPHRHDSQGEQAREETKPDPLIVRVFIVSQDHYRTP